MRITEGLKTVISGSVNALFPARCAHCGREGEFLCESCLEESTRLVSDGSCRKCALPTHSGSLCGRCAQDPPPVAALVAAFAFDGAIRSSVHAMKYEGLRAVAPLLSQQMANRWGARRKSPDVVVPVPLHRSRLRSRGYNQAELLARPVADELGLQMRPELISRTTDSGSQAEARSESERAAKVRGVFIASPDVRGLHLLLIDDVATTGSTINSAAGAALDAGAWGVSALVLAREL